MEGRWEHETRLERAGKRQTVYNIIHKLHEMNVASLLLEAERENIDSSEAKTILHDLKEKGLIYSPKPGVLACVDE